MNLGRTLVLGPEFFLIKKKIRQIVFPIDDKFVIMNLIMG